jgi:hypothetical protein
MSRLLSNSLGIVAAWASIRATGGRRLAVWETHSSSAAKRMPADRAGRTHIETRRSLAARGIAIDRRLAIAARLKLRQKA